MQKEEEDDRDTTELHLRGKGSGHFPKGAYKWLKSCILFDRVTIRYTLYYVRTFPTTVSLLSQDLCEPELPLLSRPKETRR